MKLETAKFSFHIFTTSRHKSPQQLSQGNKPASSNKIVEKTLHPVTILCGLILISKSLSSIHQWLKIAIFFKVYMVFSNPIHRVTKIWDAIFLKYVRAKKIRFSRLSPLNLRNFWCFCTCLTPARELSALGALLLVNRNDYQHNFTLLMMLYAQWWNSNLLSTDFLTPRLTNNSFSHYHGLHRKTMLVGPI